MKKLIYILTAVVFLTNSGCKKFLEESSQDEIKPGTVQDLVALMAGEGYPYKTNLHQVLNFITDDIQCNGSQGQDRYADVVKKGFSPYSWAKSMSEDVLLTGGFTNTSYFNSWAILYKQIAGCNVILGYADKVKGDDSIRQNLRGQALAMRAYYYFILVNMYAKPYNDASSTPEGSLGVPLKLDMEVSDQFPTRNTVSEVYQQIEKDLLDGADLMNRYPKDNGIFKMSPLAAYTILSRLYLYEENWDKTIEYANLALAIKSSLTQFSAAFTAAGGYYNYNGSFSINNYPGIVSNRIYDPIKSKEVIFNYLPITTPELEVFKSSISPGYSTVYTPPYAPSNDLLNLYESRPTSDNAVYLADLRSRLYFSAVGYGLSVIGGQISYSGFQPYYDGKGALGLRVAELYLNRAEANIRKSLSGGNTEGIASALKDINTLRITRYDARQVYVPINISDVNALLNFYKDERRREFSFEGHRWFDLRRYGMPALTHNYDDGTGSQTFVLKQGDSRYTLQIPQVVIDRNHSLIQNP